MAKMPSGIPGIRLGFGLIDTGGGKSLSATTARKLAGGDSTSILKKLDDEGQEGEMFDDENDRGRMRNAYIVREKKKNKNKNKVVR